jgi:hypothetical protein
MGSLCYNIAEEQFYSFKKEVSACVKTSMRRLIIPPFLKT